MKILKKGLLTMVLTLGIISMTQAQSDSKIMVGANARLFGPACTNCTALYGGGISGGYAVTGKLVTSLELNFYSKSQNVEKIKSTALGVSAEFYPREAYKGFFIGPDITYIKITDEFNNVEVFSESNITLGINLGWAISIGDRVKIIPHLGYGTWYENSKGRITLGGKLAFVI